MIDYVFLKKYTGKSKKKEKEENERRNVREKVLQKSQIGSDLSNMKDT